jgi:TonB family protein
MANVPSFGFKPVEGPGIDGKAGTHDVGVLGKDRITRVSVLLLGGTPAKPPVPEAHRKPDPGPHEKKVEPVEEHRNADSHVVVSGGEPNVRGSLDRDIVQKIVRRHLGEVKYCYDQSITRAPAPGGRVAVQFTVTAGGQVSASSLMNTTLSNLRVEKCVLEAVRRWEFPKPPGGSIAIVMYPFTFTPPN